ncbi:MAG: hypothetical protein KGH71_03895 [Candidatus Micrarchaeota archaeon]|nr:hypothetical protein [Candidatus Micrarchaeota archaeon]
MKVSVISNVASGSEELVDALDDINISVFSKEIEGDVSSAVDEIEKRVSKNDDFVIFVTDDTLEASIQLNKLSDVRAVVCNNSSDVSTARSKGVNVVIVDVEKSNPNDVAKGMAKGGSTKVPIQQRTIAPQIKRQVQEKVQRRQEVMQQQSYSNEPEKQANPITIKLQVPKIPKIELFKKKPQKAESAQKEQEDEEVRYPTGKPRKGILGKLKDYLGIID